MEHATPFYDNPTFWVAVSFFVFFGILMYVKAHKSVAAMLDAKSEVIKTQLDEALDLRKDAEKLLAEYQRKQRDAQKVAETIITDAENMAATLKVQATKDIEELVERRERLAKDKLAQAEALAIKEVKAAAVNAAVTAAKEVLATSLKGKARSGLVDASIDEVDSKLH